MCVSCDYCRSASPIGGNAGNYDGNRNTNLFTGPVPSSNLYGYSMYPAVGVLP